MENAGEIVMYQMPNGQTSINVKMENETIWLSLVQISNLFEKDKSVISRHIRNVYQEGELVKEATVAKNATVGVEGHREVIRDLEYYNLDVILSVGYRVNSKRGTQFRIWANQVLKKLSYKRLCYRSKTL